MNSNESLDLWKKAYADVLQEGKLTARDADRKIKLAEKNLERAAREVDIDPDQSLINAETAAVNAADAVLASSGFRLRGKTRSHQARFEYPGLPDEFRANADRLDRARALRGRAMYDMVDVVSATEAKELLETARLVVAAARKLLPS